MNTKPIIKDKSIKLWESNTLAVAPLNEILEPTSMKLFLWSMYKAVEQKQINKKGELEAEFHLKEFASYFNIKSPNAYAFAKKWSEKISNYQYYFKKNNPKEEFHKITEIPEVKNKKG